MGRVLFAIAVASLALAPTARAAAATIVDQDNLDRGGFEFSVRGPSVWEEQVTAGVTGILAEIDLFGNLGADGATFELFIAHGSVLQAGTPSFSTLVTDTGAEAPLLVDVSAADFQLSAGDQFIIGVEQGNGTGDQVVGNSGGYGSNLWNYLAAPYNFPPANFSETFGMPADLSFATVMSVPEPSAVVLFVLGTLGLSLVRHRSLPKAR